MLPPATTLRRAARPSPGAQAHVGLLRLRVGPVLLPYREELRDEPLADENEQEEEQDQNHCPLVLSCTRGTVTQ